MPDGSCESLRVVREKGVLTVHLHRPEACNAIDIAIVHDLGRLVDGLADATDVHTVVLRGSPGCSPAASTWATSRPTAAARSTACSGGRSYAGRWNVSTS